MADSEWLKLEDVVGKKVVSVDGHVTNEFGDDVLVFQLFRIHFSDGTSVFVEGEHDLPYIANGEPGFTNADLAKHLE